MINIYFVLNKSSVLQYQMFLYLKKKSLVHKGSRETEYFVDKILSSAVEASCKTVYQGEVFPFTHTLQF